MSKSAVLIVAFFILAIFSGLAIGDEGHKSTNQPDTFLQGSSWQNGQQIFLEGVNSSGQRIPIEAGPHWLYMHGGGCAACHGEFGKGEIVPHMCTVKSPAITYKSLTSEEHMHGSKAEPSGEHEEKHVPYTIDGIRTAITNGVEPSGETLNPCMPRWKLSEKDFKDLLAYLIKLDER